MKSNNLSNDVLKLIVNINVYAQRGIYIEHIKRKVEGYMCGALD